VKPVVDDTLRRLLPLAEWPAEYARAVEDREAVRQAASATWAA
jgi:hypothetical protein